MTVFCVIYTGKISKKRSKKQIQVQAEKEKNLAAVDWFEENVIKQGSNMRYDGTFEIMVRWCDHPEVLMEARGRKLAAAEKVSKNMQEKGVLNPKVVILIWEEELTAAGLDKEDIILVLEGDKPSCKFYAIVGDHTVGAMVLNLDLKPNSVEYASVWARIVVCPKTEQNMQHVLNYGNLDNMVQNSGTVTTIWDVTKSVHYKLATIDRQRINQQQKNVMKTEIRDDYKASSSFRNTTLCTAFALAARKGEVWNCVERIYEEGAKKSSGKKKKNSEQSIHHFAQMSAIPEKTLCAWLHNVLEGNLTSQQFLSRCKLYKKTVSVQNKILSHVNVVMEQDFQRYKDLIKKYPGMQDKQWNKRMVDWSDDVAKNPLKQPVKDSVMSIIRAQELADEQKKAAKSMVLYMYIYCHIHKSYQKKFFMKRFA